MRNLAHLPIEKLELLPAKHSPRMKIDWTTFQLTRDDNLRYPNSTRGSAWSRLYRKIELMCKSSVGQNWNDVYSKIKAVCKNVHFNFMVDYYIRNIIAIPIWSRRNQRWEYNMRYGENLDLLSHLNSLKRMTSNHIKVFYYVCPITNIVRVAKSKVWNYERNSDWWRRHYKFITDRKKRKKREKLSPAIFKMINQPELYKFYSSIKKEYNNLMNFTGKRLRPIPKKKAGNILEICCARLNNKRFSKEQIKLESLKYQIENLEAGNFNSFFESAVYLYAQQKECHHFAQP